ncbi:MAG: hypothetical protein ACTS2F_25590 [Thainema sp.]
MRRTAKAFANRKKEVQLFLNMVQGKHPARIFLIEATSGMGKSNLLNKFRRECPKSIHQVSLNLRCAEIGLPYLFNTIQNDIGQKNFPHFQQELHRLLSGSINFSGNQMEGEQTIQIALNIDETIRNFRLMKLQDAFFLDLAILYQPITILIDSFEEGIDEVKNWIEGEFLKKASKIPGLTVVVAGQIVPNPNNIDWGDNCEHHCLNAIQVEEDWYEFVDQADLPFSKDVTRAIVCLCKGNPLQVCAAFDTLLANGDWE